MENNEFNFRGIATVNFFASDLTKAKSWYSALFSVEPYFQVPGYIEFRIGGDSIELGIIDSKFAPNALPENPSGAVIYWQVSDLEGTIDYLARTGATVHQSLKDRGNGFKTASFIDPFGNIVGIMHNPHFLEIRGSGLK